MLIVESDASNLGYGGILKQEYNNQILSIVLCISKFQSDLKTKKFILKIICKATKDILQKDVKNLVSKQIFAKWQGLVSNFDFEIEFIKGVLNSLLDFLTREFLQGKDPPPS